MPRPAQRAYSRTSLEAGRLFGRLIRLARREKRMPARELAERIGASRATVQRMEKGDLKVEAGLYFEAATVLGVALFTPDPADIARARRNIDDRLALLPEPPRRQVKDVHDRF